MLERPADAVQPIDADTEAAVRAGRHLTRDGRRHRRRRPRSSASRHRARGRLPRPPERSAKPRERGITHVLDKGLSVAEVDGLIEVAGRRVDIVKLGWGTALVTGNLEPKLERYRAHGMPVVLGGTLTELAIAQGRVDGLVAWLRELGLRHVEISDGTIALAHDAQARADRAAGAASSRCSPRSAPRTTRASWRRTAGSSRSSASSRPARGR